MSGKKLLYIGHEYHKKTKSNNFLIRLLETKYEVFCVTYNVGTKKFSGNKEVLGRHFDVLVLWQMPVPVKLLKKIFLFDHGVYIPMYDGTGEMSNDFWIGYRDFNIINFSKTLHERLIKMGLSSYYIQYFPPVSSGFIPGKEDEVYFWQRRNSINIHTVCNLLEQSRIKKMHMHKAVDPDQNFIQPKKIQEQIYQITYSDWYEKKEDMLQDVKEAAIYIAPREYEGIGMSFLEAMAMGKFVIAPDHPTMNEYIRHGVTGYLYDLNDVKPVGNIDIRQIQYNTYAYMKEGCRKWEKRKYCILDWLEKDVTVNHKLLKKAYNEKNIIGKKYLAGRILLITQEGEVFKLFGRIKLNKNMMMELIRLKRKYIR